MSADFVAIDVETANADCSSICQVGCAVVRDGKVTETFSTLVDPEDHFDPINTSIHGLTAKMVRGSPTFARAFEAVRQAAGDGLVVSHSSFDRTAIDRACTRCGGLSFAVRWLDSARIARRAWPEQFAERGYGLSKVARFLKIEFRHHDAGEDARAAAEVVLAALRHSALSLEEWHRRARPRCATPPGARQANFAEHSLGRLALLPLPGGNPAVQAGGRAVLL